MAGVVHISEEEASRDFGALMQHVRSGDEVRLDCKDGVQAVVKRAEADSEADVLAARAQRSATRNPPVPVRRTIAEAREILRLRRETQGLAVPDPEFASDMEEIHALYNQPMDMSRWD